MAILVPIRLALKDPDLVAALERAANRTEIRKNLRKLAGERLSWVLDNHADLMSHKDWARNVRSMSEFHVHNGGTLNFRPTFGSIRDRFNLDTLLWICIAIGPQRPSIPTSQQHDAAVNIASACISSPVAFGHPSHLSTDYFNSESETLMTGIRSALAAYDHLTTIGGRSGPEVIAAAQAADSQVGEGLRIAVANRESTPDRPTYTELTDEARELVEEINGHLPDLLEGSASDDAEPASPSSSAYDVPEGEIAGLINMTLRQAGLPEIEALVAEINEKTTELEQARLAAAATTIAPIVDREAGHGDIPEGNTNMVLAHEAMGLTRGKDTFDFNVPVWEWAHPHPHVPEADPNYIFKPDELLRVLYAIVTGQRCYLHGHTGTGKTTLIEQVAARLNWPVMRVNFDSEITRMDLIGRDVLSNEDGATTSCFVDGVLPQMMSGPYIGIFDEIDFVRPDVAYVMQRALEGNGLVITEDGGRVVQPHPMFRIFATGNTTGQGDEFGLYQGARPQSMAMLDRFNVWVSVDYMNDEERVALLRSQVPGLEADHASMVSRYVGEHLEAFTNAQVMQPISPRGYVALGQAIATFTGLFPATKRREAITEAFAATILDRASQQDRAVLRGIAERVMG